MCTKYISARCFSSRRSWTDLVTTRGCSRTMAFSIYVLASTLCRQGSPSSSLLLNFLSIWIDDAESQQCSWLLRHFSLYLLLCRLNLINWNFSKETHKREIYEYFVKNNWKRRLRYFKNKMWDLDLIKEQLHNIYLDKFLFQMPLWEK